MRVPALPPLAVVFAALAVLAWSVAPGGRPDGRIDAQADTEERAPASLGAVAPGPATAPGQLAASVEPAGETLRLAMVRPTSFRPDALSLTDQGAVLVADLVYDGLTEVVGTDGVLRPGLAERWESDGAFRTWTFHLAPDAGVEAAAVVASLAPVLGVGPGASGRSATAITSDALAIRAPAPDRVVIELRSPNAGLPWLLSGLAYSVVDGVRATGDYRITADGVAGMRLQRRPDRPASAGPAEVLVRWTETADAAADLVADGLVDGAVVEPGAPIAGRWSADHPASTVAVRYLVLDRRSPRLASPWARQQLLDLVDPAALVADVGDSAWHSLDGLVAPGLAGADTDLVSTGSVDRDPAARARTQATCPLCEMGQGSGPDPGPSAAGPPAGPLRLTVADESQAGLAAALIGRLRRADVDASWERVSPGELAADIVAGSTDLFGFGWVATAGSIDAVVPPLLGPDSPANVARVGSEELSDLLDRAAVTGDDAERWALLERAHRLALAEATVLPISVSAGTLVLAPDVSGVLIRADGSLDLETTGEPSVRFDELLESGAQQTSHVGVAELADALA